MKYFLRKNSESESIRQVELLNDIIENIDVGLIRCSYPQFKIIDYNNRAFNDFMKINPKINLKINLKINPLTIFKGLEAKNDFIIDMEIKVELLNIIENMLSETDNLVTKNVKSLVICRKFIRDGEDSFYKFIYRPYYGLEKVVEVIIIEIDITEEVKAKQKMEDNLKMHEELFANVSHELKTPLNVIYSTNQLIESYLNNNTIEVSKNKVLKKLKIIKQNCYRFTKLINNIIDLSKIDSGFYKLELRNDNIVGVVENIVQSVSEYIKGNELNVVFDTDIEEKIIAFDPYKIERVILNLISNSIKFSNPGNEINICVKDKNDYVEISVKDNGIGIEKKHLDIIFERFGQVDKSLVRNAEGSGIGLSLVKSIIELHNGKIRAESKVGKGSIFIIELPNRIIEHPKLAEQIKPINSKIDMIKIEFSDIYSK